jgi:hypothetical protein
MPGVVIPNPNEPEHATIPECPRCRAEGRGSQPLWMPAYSGAEHAVCRRCKLIVSNDGLYWWDDQAGVWRPVVRSG